jgi:hypothetical protein
MRVPLIPNTVILFLAVLILAYLYAIRTGLIDARHSPLPEIDIASPSGWFIDWRIAALARDRALCRRVMAEPVASIAPLPDTGFDERGCGYVNAVSLKQAGGAEIGASPVTCQTAAAFALWVIHVVQPEAQRLLGARVARIGDFGTYSCRNMIGGFYGRHGKTLERLLKGSTLSTHATADAIDISGFTLANGDTVNVKRDWSAGGRKAEFLRRVHAGACRYFRVTLGPDANREHHDHLHVDRGFLRACR